MQSTKLATVCLVLSSIALATNLYAGSPWYASVTIAVIVAWSVWVLARGKDHK